MEHNILLKPSGLKLKVKHGSLLYDVLKEHNIEFPCGGNGICGNCKVKILKGEISLTEKHLNLLSKKNLSKEWRLACFSKVESDLIIELPINKMSIQSDSSTVKNFTPEEGYGIAIDLGSTTIALQLINMYNGNIVNTSTCINPQSRYGADIMSRITFALHNNENTDLLKTIIREAIYKEVIKLIEKIPNNKLKKIVIVGNSVMHHLFIGLDVSPLSVYPFQSLYNNEFIFTPKDLNWSSINNECEILFLPNISNFIGSDILSGIHATKMQNSNEYNLLIDLGTNGEIVLGNKEKLYCTSTAAGPAFEGINITCGMRASSGAIYSVEFNDGNFSIKTIHNKKASGICGSGLIDCIYCLLKNNKIDYTGKFTNNNNNIFITNNIYISDKDIREFQLAKSAISTGIEILLNEANIKSEDINKIFLTGGLGNFVNIKNIQSLGLLNNFSSSKIYKLENTSLYGCKELLFDSNHLQIKNILEKTQFCSLETNYKFTDLFYSHLYFPNNIS